MIYLKTFYKRILFLLLIYSSSRVLFYIFNNEYFSSNILGSIVEGIRFDISALFYINIPLLILLLFPIEVMSDLMIAMIKRIGDIYILNPCIRLLEYCRNIKTNIWYRKITNILFYMTNIPFILVNNADIEYYNFSLKRTTSDIFEYLSLGRGSDAIIMIPQYLIDYWHVTIIIVVQIFLLLRIRSIPSKKIKLYRMSIILFVFSIGIFVLGARGGMQLKPIKPIDAGILTNFDNSALILNSPFCIIHTFFEEGISEKNYFKEEDISEIYNTNHLLENNKFSNKNVIIIILESYSKEFVGYYNNGNGYTPFLDNLIQHSLVMENAYSNGIKSIEALPAITASIPALMNNPFITSPYSTNKYNGIGALLTNEGYASSFFHGGKKGTMGFYQFSKKAGFKKYFGMDNYPEKNDYDGSWGIYDEPFFNYYLEYLNSEKEPFVSSIFSVSSHPPYVIPTKYKGVFPKGNLDIHESIGYTDFSLKKFFENAKKEQWYERTLFVITADHTSPESEKGKNKIERYSIPIIYFLGDSSLKGKEETITQQIDIMPTILDIIGYNKEFFSFGKSISNKSDWAISFINNEYLLIHQNGFLIERNETYTNFSDKNMTIKKKEDGDIIKLLQAIKQKYNNSLIRNNLTTHEN